MAPTTTMEVAIEMFIERHAKGRIMPTCIEQRVKP
jgi:hypothetical protein